jgi:putative transposase
VPEYRRAFQPGGTFFLTLVTHGRAPLFADGRARRCLHEAVALARRDHPFTLVAAVLLPEHLHLLLTLPEGDADFSIRVGAVKARFTRQWLAGAGAGGGGGGIERRQSDSRARQGYRGVWQKRFWEHAVRDAADRVGCCDYLHYNPVKHGHVVCPHEWEWSTFHRFVRERKYEHDWCCACAGDAPSGLLIPPDIRGAEMDV